MHSQLQLVFYVLCLKFQPNLLYRAFILMFGCMQFISVKIGM